MSTTKHHKLILGVDPGTVSTGYGLLRLGRPLEVVDYGCIRPPRTAPLADRYRIIFESIRKLIDRHAPSELAIETQFVGKNPQSAIKLGMARGVIVLAASLQQIPVFEYSPSRVKNAVVGNGRASKVQIKEMLRLLLDLRSPPQPEDAADALALAVCHAHRQKRDHV